MHGLSLTAAIRRPRALACHPDLVEDLQRLHRYWGELVDLPEPQADVATASEEPRAELTGERRHHVGVDDEQVDVVRRVSRWDARYITELRAPGLGVPDRGDVDPRRTQAVGNRSGDLTQAKDRTVVPDHVDALRPRADWSREPPLQATGIELGWRWHDARRDPLGEVDAPPEVRIGRLWLELRKLVPEIGVLVPEIREVAIHLWGDPWMRRSSDPLEEGGRPVAQGIGGLWLLCEVVPLESSAVDVPHALIDGRAILELAEPVGRQTAVATRRCELGDVRKADRRRRGAGSGELGAVGRRRGDS